MPKRVLVTGAGGERAMAFIKSLSSSLGEVEVFAADAVTSAPGLYLVPQARRIALPHVSASAYATRILELCRRARIDVLVPTLEAEQTDLARARATFEAHGTRVTVATAGTLETCADEVRLMAACATTGSNPRWTLLDGATAVERIELPVMVKPRARGDGGARIVTSLDALETLPRDGTWIMQEYLPGEACSVDVYAREDGAVLAAVPALTLRAEAGVTMAARTFHDSIVEETAIAIAEALRVTGLATIRLRRRASGEARMVGVHLGVTGGISLTVAAGVPTTRMLIESALGHHPPATRFAFRDVAMVRAWQDHFVAPEEIDAAWLAPAPAA